MDGEIHIHNIAIVPDMRRKGIGTRLLSRALEWHMDQWGRPGVVSLEVRESNSAAQRFYAALGFGITGRRPFYYKDEGALLMEARSEDILK